MPERAAAEVIWHHECSHDCRRGLGCNDAEHYRFCRCLVITARHAAQARDRLARFMEGGSR